MIRYRHILSAIALLTCFAATIFAAATPVAGPVRGAVSAPTGSPSTPPTRTPAATVKPSPSPTVAASPSATPIAPTVTGSPAGTPATSNHISVLSYLTQVIAWYRIVVLEEQTASDPGDILYISDSRQMAGEVLHLAFDYAHAQVVLKKATADDHAAVANENATAVSSDLVERHARAQAEVSRLTAKVSELKARLRSTAASSRDPLNRELAATQGQLELAQSHVDSLSALIEYESGSAAGDNSRNSLEAKIGELESSLPREGQGKDAGQTSEIVSTSEGLPPNAGFFARGEFLITLQGRQQALDAALKLTAELAKEAGVQRDQLIQSLNEIDDRSVLEAHEATSSNIATVRETQNAFKQLAARRKLVSDAMQPLSKQIVTLNLYSTNLERWRLANSRRFRAEIRTLILRAGALGLLIGIVSLAAFVWRKLTFHYIPDPQRRSQVMQLRRFAVGIAVVLILLFGLGGDLRVLATVMGFAAAGIALALQNVILSFAGYFYIGGRFGIRVGDRIQLGGIAGDVLEIGLFKLTLMELKSDASNRQPTGRIVVFPNSIVFQPNGNYFNQLPGSNYTWNELRLTLAPDCDYRLAEQRLMEVVGAVFGRFRDSIQRDYHNVESSLNVRFENPRPQSRLQFNDAGIEVVVRYPVPLQATTQAADEIARRLIDAINREPGLRLVPQSNPALQRAVDATDGVAVPAAPSTPASVSDGNAGITPAAAAVAGAVGMAAADAVVAAASASAPLPAEPPKR